MIKLLKSNKSNQGTYQPQVKMRPQNFHSKKSSKFLFYNPSPLPSLSKTSSAILRMNFILLCFFKCSFHPLFPVKHIRSLLVRSHGSFKLNQDSILEGNECEVGLDKSFGFSKHFTSLYELGEEVGCGEFRYTCSAKAKKRRLKGHDVAVKVIPKSKMTITIAIEDLRRHVKILRALIGHKNLVQFYEAYEDDDNVYIVME